MQQTKPTAPHPHFIAMWEFWVKAEHQAAFELAYGSAGTWVKLFKKADGFMQTECVQDTTQPLRYVVTDNWQSEAHYEAFLNDFKAEYQTLDQHCEAFTERESKIGWFKAL